MNHKFNNTKVINLESIDFDNNKLIVNGQNFPGKVLILIWASYCGHCMTASEQYKQIVDRYNNSTTLGADSITLASVQSDGPEKDRKAVGILEKIAGPIQGVPTYLYFKNGKFVQVYNGGRDANSIVSFLDKK